MNYLIIQTPAEIKWAKSDLGEQFDEVKKIAWTPFAVDALRKDGIEYTTTSHYMKDKDDSNRVINIYKILQKICELADRHATQEIRDLERLRIRLFMGKLCSFRLLFSLYFGEIENLEILKEYGEGEKFFYYHYAGAPWSLLSRIIEANSSGNWRKSFISLDPQGDFITGYGDQLTSYHSRREGLFRKVLRFLFKNHSQADFFSLVNSLVGGRLTSKNKINILVFDVSWGLPKILKKFKNKTKSNLIFWEYTLSPKVKPLVELTQKVINRLKRDPEIRREATYQGINLLDLMMPEIKKVLDYDLPIILSNVKKFNKLNQRLRFKTAVSSYYTPEWEPILDQFTFLGVPVVIFFHGGGTAGVLKKFPFVAFFTRNFKKHKEYQEYYVVYSDILVKECEKEKRLFPDCNMEFINGGSVYFEELIAQFKDVLKPVSSHRLKLCYVCGGLGVFNSAYKKGLYSDVCLYDLRYKVIDILKDKSNLELYYKMGYNTEKFGLDLEKEILENKYKNIKAISSDKPFKDVLGECEVVILEISSSTLFEALCTKKHIILLLDERVFSLTEKAEELLVKRVVMAKTEREFKRYLEDMAEQGWAAKLFNKCDNANTEFIDTYLPPEKAKSVEKGVDILSQVLNI